MLNRMKKTVSSRLELRAMEKHRSRVGRKLAPKYSSYLERARAENPLKWEIGSDTQAAVDEFSAKGFTKIWSAKTEEIARSILKYLEKQQAAGEIVWSEKSENGSQDYLRDPWKDIPQFKQLFENHISGFLVGYYRTSFKIFYGKMYRSEGGSERPSGSQLWHSDGGPGTCINVMVYLTPTDSTTGAMELLPWDTSFQIYQAEVAADLRDGLAKYGETKRDRICGLYADEIEHNFASMVEQPSGPSGVIVPFLNNTIHRGGFPDDGKHRIATVFHCYPSHEQTDLHKYDRKGVAKTGPYPIDPAASF